MQKLDLALKERITDKSLKLKNINIPHAKNATWSVEKKIEAVTTYLALGNLRHVAAVTGVSHGMIKQWRIQPWWKELEAEIIASRRITSANKLSKIVDKSLDVIDDRLDNGDFVYNSKSGELLRKPVTLRDATSAANALMQRAAIIEKLNKDEAVVEAAASIQEQLASLAAEFAKMNKRDNSKATTVEFKEQDDALYERREEGLQEGGEGIHLETLRGQEEDGTEQGETFDGESWESSQGRRESRGSREASLQGGLL
jgi:transposase-like protein